MSCSIACKQELFWIRKVAVKNVASNSYTMIASICSTRWIYSDAIRLLLSNFVVRMGRFLPRLDGDGAGFTESLVAAVDTLRVDTNSGCNLHLKALHSLTSLGVFSWLFLEAIIILFFWRFLSEIIALPILWRICWSHFRKKIDHSILHCKENEIAFEILLCYNNIWDHIKMSIKH